MVFLAVLRDPARLYRGFPLDSGKAVGRDGDVRVDPAAVLPALARYLACALGELPPAVQAVLLAADRRCAAPGLLRRRAGRRALCADQPVGDRKSTRLNSSH